MTTKHDKVGTYCKGFPPVKSHTPLINLYAHQTFQGGEIALVAPTHTPIHIFFYYLLYLESGFLSVAYLAAANLARLRISVYC